MSNQYSLRLRRARFNCEEEKYRKLINTKRLIEGEGTLLNSLCWQSSRTQAFAMAKTVRSEMDDISTMGDQENSRWSETVKSDGSSDSEQTMPSDTPSGEKSEVGGRVRLYSESQVYTVSRWQDNEDRASAEDGGTGDGARFRGRSQSAPAALWKAKKYGRQLRRMSDEFDTWLDRGEIRKASSTGKQTNQGWFSFLWGSKEEEGRE